MSLTTPLKTLSMTDLFRLSSLINEGFGVHFKESRFKELERKINHIAKELDIVDLRVLENMLISNSLSEEQRMLIARHLTVGETFFFRDPKMFSIFKDVIMADVISSKIKSSKQIRILSAGCSTGEEPYTIAVLLHRHFESLRQWHINITAIDVNEESLNKARRAVYREWSFRGAPEWLKTDYFIKKGKEGYELSEVIRSMVQFQYYNLACNPEDFCRVFAGFDVIFCRNVVMYFNEDLRHTVADMLYRSLVRGGWLIVSPVEASSLLFSRYETLNIDGTTLFRKGLSDDFSIRAAELLNTQRNRSLTESFDKAIVNNNKAQPSYNQYVYPSEKNNFGKIINPAKPIAQVDIIQATNIPDSLMGNKEKSFALKEARKMADLGMLDEAMSLLETIAQEHKLDPELYYLKALILEEKGDLNGAEEALKRVLYLDNNSALARFRLGNILFNARKGEEALREFNSVVSILGRKDHEETLEDFGNMSVKRIIEVSMSIIREIEMQ